uniref:Uncharacterized protein n=1 Tax=Paramoeba aestuarina TaxID=180227 RepID=A0A7S4JYG9_9EUKA|mmetsp:Transcript_13999/g.21769  ORF Transcript_13999/g.21769 Transcript_13999/m.21769 type:complete len:233 (+) Transcript_13999:348-1046(+)
MRCKRFLSLRRGRNALGSMFMVLVFMWFEKKGDPGTLLVFGKKFFDAVDYLLKVFNCKLKPKGSLSVNLQFSNKPPSPSKLPSPNTNSRKRKRANHLSDISSCLASENPLSGETFQLPAQESPPLSENEVPIHEGEISMPSGDHLTIEKEAPMPDRDDFNQNNFSVTVDVVNKEPFVLEPSAGTVFYHTVEKKELVRRYFLFIFMFVFDSSLSSRLHFRRRPLHLPSSPSSS